MYQHGIFFQLFLANFSNIFFQTFFKLYLLSQVVRFFFQTLSSTFSLLNFFQALSGRDFFVPTYNFFVPTLNFFHNFFLTYFSNIFRNFSLNFNFFLKFYSIFFKHYSTFSLLNFFQPLSGWDFIALMYQHIIFFSTFFQLFSHLFFQHFFQTFLSTLTFFHFLFHFFLILSSTFSIFSMFFHKKYSTSLLLSFSNSFLNFFVPNFDCKSVFSWSQTLDI